MLRGGEGGDDREKYHQARVEFRLQSGENTKTNPEIIGMEDLQYEKHYTTAAL